MKAIITFEIDVDEVCKILDKLREHRIADQKELEESHPIPMPPFMTEEPLTATAEAMADPFVRKKNRTNEEKN